MAFDICKVGENPSSSQVLELTVFPSLFRHIQKPLDNLQRSLSHKSGSRRRWGMFNIWHISFRKRAVGLIRDEDLPCTCKWIFYWWLSIRQEKSEICGVKKCLVNLCNLGLVSLYPFKIRKQLHRNHIFAQRRAVVLQNSGVSREDTQCVPLWSWMMHIRKPSWGTFKSTWKHTAI